jgi:hypothetical protein
MPAPQLNVLQVKMEVVDVTRVGRSEFEGRHNIAVALQYENAAHTVLSA